MCIYGCVHIYIYIYTHMYTHMSCYAIIYHKHSNPQPGITISEKFTIYPSVFSSHRSPDYTAAVRTSILRAKILPVIFVLGSRLYCGEYSLQRIANSCDTASDPYTNEKKLGAGQNGYLDQRVPSCFLASNLSSCLDCTDVAGAGQHISLSCC